MTDDDARTMATRVALIESWLKGYLQAVETLREIAIMFRNEQIRRAFVSTADMLEYIAQKLTENGEGNKDKDQWSPSDDRDRTAAPEALLPE